MNKTIHALLVGINEYDSRANINRLYGCINDLKKIKDLLINQYKCADNQIVTLENSEAIREAVLKNFQGHLCDNKNIKKGDIVFFYFSGHGSYAPTAPEFEQFDGKKQEETLVCYDSRVPEEDCFDLSDKEIAVLLSRVPEEVEIVVIVDACHSASITREVINETDKDLIARYLPKSVKPRNLSSYLLEHDNYYENLERFSIPTRQHIALSACNRDQKAWEKFGQGVFTNQLLYTLEKGGYHQISYRRLYEFTCFAVRTKVTNQTPQISVPNNFNVDKIFLQEHTLTDVPPFLVEYRNGHWCLNHGAIYGLCTDSAAVEAMQVAIYQPNEKGKFEHLENVKVKAVKLKECHLESKSFEKEYAKQLAKLPECAPKSEKVRPVFMAEIISVPTNLFIYLNGSETEQTNFLTYLASINTPYPFIDFVTKKANLRYELVITPNELLIKNLETEQLIHGCEGTDFAAVAYIVQKIAQIEEWERMLSLDNEVTKLDRSGVAVRFLEESNNDFFYTPTIHLSTNQPQILFQIHARNLSGKNLYIGLVHLSRQFGIESFYECGELLATNTDWLTLDNQHVLGFGKDKAPAVTDIFKVIVSTDPFNDYKFNKKGLLLGEVIAPQNYRDAIRRKTILEPESDWFTHTITTHLTQQNQELKENTVSLKNNSISIKSPSKFRAKLGLTSINASTKSVHPAHYLSEVFKEQPYELINFATNDAKANYNDQTIINLNEIENEAALAKNPLIIEIDKSIIQNEYILPITFDGEHFIPFGTVQKADNGNTIIHLHELPAVDQPYEQEQTRSARRALWFCLLKVTGNHTDAFRLKYIWKYEDDAPIYGNLSTSEIKEKVEKADSILLLIHGIIGNTHSMAKAVQPLFGAENYPLILTFDYENLHTEIEKIAEILDTELDKIGLGKHSSKTIDVVAHSMGGLVMRYLIERLRKGHLLVDKLLLFGTPNGGSNFSNLNKFRDISLAVLTVAANTSKYLMLPLTPLLYAVNGGLGATKFISTTLKQMHPESTFIKGLSYNDQAANTKYFIIAGNVQKYQPEGGWWYRLKEKMEVKKYQWVYDQTPSDLIVSVPQITSLPDTFKVTIIEIGCYHTNYFEVDDGIQVLLEILLRT